MKSTVSTSYNLVGQKNLEKNKKVLVIAYFFPPTGGVASAAAQRTLKLVRYMPSFGWQPVILTARECKYESYIDMDATLLEKVPKELEIHRSTVMRGIGFLLRLRKKILNFITVKRSSPEDGFEGRPKNQSTATPIAPEKISRYAAFKNAITDLFQIPDEQVGWLIPAIILGRKILKKNDFDVIFATGKPWTSHMIGLVLSFLTKRPLVTEFQDPWTTNPFKPKYSFIKTWFENRLEQLSVKRSSLVIITTKELKNEFISRFPEQLAEKFLYLSNCYDPVDIPKELPPKYSEDVFTLLHLGYLYVKRDPRNFLLGLRIALDEGWIDKGHIKFLQVGTVSDDFCLEPFIEENSLGEVVELRGQVPLQVSLETLWQADCLLLLQPGTSTQMPSKLFEYIITGQPILAISPKNSAVWKFSLENSLGSVADADNPREIAKVLAEFYTAWRNKDSSKQISPDVLHRYSAISITAELAKNMDAISVDPAIKYK